MAPPEAGKPPRDRSPADEGAGRKGLIAAGAGGLLTLLAFFAMPMLSLPLIGPVTMPSAIIFATSLGLSSWNVLWVVPAVAAGIAVRSLAAGIRTTSSVAGRLTTAGAVQPVSVVIGLAYLLLPFILTDNGFVSTGASARALTWVLGFGYYLGALGMIVAFLGATMAAADIRRMCDRGSR